MVKEVYKNIYTFQVVLPKSPLKATNIYIIKDRDKNLVLDTGYHRFYASRFGRPWS